MASRVWQYKEVWVRFAAAALSGSVVPNPRSVGSMPVHGLESGR